MWSDPRWRLCLLAMCFLAAILVVAPVTPKGVLGLIATSGSDRNADAGAGGSDGGWDRRTDRSHEPGVLPGVDLVPAGSITVSEDDAVVEGLDVDGCITIRADRVTVRNVRVRCGGRHGIRTYAGNRGTVIHHADIAMVGDDPHQSIVGGPHGHVRYVRIVDLSGADGIRTASGTVYEHNYVEVGKPPGSGKHTDAIQSTGNHDVVIRDNTLIARAADGGNAAILVKSDLGRAEGWTIEDNYLDGGSYTVYWRDGGNGCPTKGRLVNNRFGPDHRNGPLSTSGCGGPNLDVDGNVWDRTDEPVW